MVHQKPAYTIKEVENLLSLSHAKLYQEISSRRILTYKVGKRRFVSCGAVDQYIVDRETETVVAANAEVEKDEGGDVAQQGGLA